MLVRRFRQLQKALRLVVHPEYRRGLFQGIGATIEHRHQLKDLGLRTVVDIGANVGQFSLLIRGMYPEAQVFAFEPLSRAAAKFIRLHGQDGHVRFFQKAIAPFVAKQAMHVSRRDDSSSLLAIGTGQTEYAPGTDEVSTEEVSLATLDECVKPEGVKGPALLKLDVQGYELEVLKGASQCLKMCEMLLLEVSFQRLYTHCPLAHEVIGFLGAKGFHVYDICSFVQRPADNELTQCDLVFARADSKLFSYEGWN